MANRSNLLRLGAPIMIATLALVIALGGALTTDTSDQNDQADPSNEYEVSEVNVETVDVLLAESYPVQVFVEVTGYLPDPCWEAQEPVTEQNGNRVDIEILAERKVDEVCPQVIEEYRTTIELGTLEPGEWVVSVNGVEQEFEVH
jgi:inhibitor of cysteine peptidase